MARSRREVKFQFAGVGWQVEAWTVCRGDGEAAECSLDSYLLSGEGARVYLPVSTACGKRLEPEFTLAWVEHSPSSGTLTILAVEVGTKTPVRVELTSDRPEWVCK